MTGHLNILDEIKIDHNNIKDLWARYKSATSEDEKGIIRNTMIREIAVHSEAEEVTVYNNVDHDVGKDAGKHLRDEHQALEEVLYSVDMGSVTDTNDDAKLSQAIKMFLEHSAEEETEPGYLAQLSKSLSAEENDALAKKFLAARKVVPERPHPMAPQSGGIVQKALGSMTKPHDKIVAALTSRKFTDIKYTHPANGPVESLQANL